MGIGESGPKSPGGLAFYSTTDAARLSELAPEALSHCLAEGLVKTVIHQGEQCISASDLMKLKLLRAMVSVQMLEEGVARIYRQMGRERTSEWPQHDERGSADLYARIVRLILRGEDRG